MPHQCVHCKRILPQANSELLEGCANCGGKFFFYIREEALEKIKEQPIEITEIPKPEKEKIEKEVREIAGIEDSELPVILDLESVKAIGPGKYEIDVVNLFRKDRPLIYKLEEGKYIIDLTATLGVRDREE